MKYVVLAASAVALAACNPFVAPKSCYWKHTKWAVQTDTVYNEAPNTGQQGWVPYILVTRLVSVDSVRLCD